MMYIDCNLKKITEIIKRNRFCNWRELQAFSIDTELLALFKIRSGLREEKGIESV